MHGSLKAASGILRHVEDWGLAASPAIRLDREE